MAFLRISSTQKLGVIIAISFAFFVAEIAVGFKTGSLALVADAFHYLNDLIGFCVALGAILVTQRATSPKDFSFGWVRASLLGAFFNGVFLLALGVSIFLQSIERFVSIQHVENPKLVLIMGCIGLTLNIFSAALLGHEHHGHDHGHDHDPAHDHNQADGHDHPHSHSEIRSPSHRPANIDLGMASTGSADQVPMTPISAHANHRHNIAKLSSSGRDLGMMGALIHVIGDALNNIGVIIAALVIMFAKYDGRFYADPGVSLGISMMILLSSIPLVKNSGKILMQSAPRGVDFDDVRHDLEKIPGIESVHELHIWRLDQKKSIASAHVVVSDDNVTSFMENARTIKECLHAYGVHSVTLQPELAQSRPPTSRAENGDDSQAVKNSENTQQIYATVSTPAPVPGSAASITGSSIRRRRIGDTSCQMMCGNLCENLTCCAIVPPRIV